MKKRTLSFLLTLVLIFSAFPIGGFSITANAATSGDYEYTVLSDGTAEITDYTGSATELTIPSEIDGYTVTSIGDYAFSNTNIISVRIPDSITTISDGAFCFCDSLTNISIPDSITSIGNDVFSYCSALISINVDENNSSYSCLDGVLFNKDKTALICYPRGKNDSIYDIPDGVNTIGYNAFYNCSALTSITVPDSANLIDVHAFYNCSSLTSVNIPNGVTTIGLRAFYNCSGITNITIPDSVTTIGDSAFRNCTGLATSITIPDSVTSIGDDVFYNCSGITSIYVDENNNSYCSLDGVLFDKCKTVLICYPAGKKGTTYIVPDSVTTIGNSAFCLCTSLTNVSIGNGITTIGNSAFRGCYGLTSLTIPDSVTSIGYNAFSSCYGLMDITIGNGVTLIGDGAFYNCSGLTSITIPNSVISIGGEAFGGCYKLTNVIIGDGVTSIGSYAFGCCYELTSVIVGDSVISIGEDAFNDCSKLISIIIPDSVTSIGEDAFYNCLSLKNVYYHNGTSTLRSQIDIGLYNDNLIDATWHYGHLYTNCSDATCNLCGDVRLAGHSYSAATCTAPKTCKVCKATTGAALGHSYKTTVTKATTKANGKKVTKCTRCGKTSSSLTINKIGSIKLSTTSYSYSGSSKKPTVTIKDSKGNKISTKYYTVKYTNNKNIGTATAKVTFKGDYSGTKSLTFKINPKKVSSLKLKSSKKKQLTVSWGKDSKVSGYEIVYATNSKFTKGKKTVKITSYKTQKKTLQSLKSKKTYYVKVRAYKTVKGKKYYGAYTSAKKIKIK